MNDHAKNITIFGQVFESSGGLYALAIADGMHPEDPVTCPDYHLDTLDTRLGEVIDDDLEPFANACSALREKYGHEVWVGESLVEYLRSVKGMEKREATETRDRMVAEAEARFAPLYAEYEHRRSLGWIRHLEVLIKNSEDAAAHSRKQLVEAKARLGLTEAA